MTSRIHILCSLLILAVVSNHCSGQPAQVSPEVVAKLSGQLSSEDFQTRQEASGNQPDKAGKNDEGKKLDPLQALKEAYAKGVSTTPVEVKDLPKEISEGSAKARPGAAIRTAQRLEIKHTLKYVAFDKPRVQSYQAVLVNGDKRSRVQVAPDGDKLAARPVAGKNAEPGKKADDAKEIDIPDKASKAVKAIKELYPKGVVVQITTEVYQDPSGTVDVLTYEIEFLLDGGKREMVASPDGIIPHLWKSIAEKELPRAVAATLAKEDAKIESLTQFEIRAGLQFAPLDKPRIIYQLEVEKDGKTSKLNLRADGSVVPAPVRPGVANRSYLGLSFEKNSTTVAQVVKGGPAEQAGIRASDKILMVGDAKIGAVADLLKVLQSTKPGAEVRVQLQRGEAVLTVTVKLAAPPE
jgi:hypothetical protein